MKRIIPALIGAALLIGILAAIAFTFLSPAYLGPELARLARAEGGLELRLKQAPELQLLPRLEVRIRGAELYAPSGARLAAIPEIRITPSLGELLARKLGDAEVELLKPEFSLGISPEGEASWAGAAPEAPGWKGAVLIREGRLKFLDERSGDNFTANGIDGRLGAAEGLSFEGGLYWGQERLQLSAFIRDPSRFAGGGSPADIRAQMSRLRFTFSGQARLDQGLALAGRMEAESPDLLELARWSGFEVPQGAAPLRFAASGAFEGKAGRAAFTGADFQIQGMKAQGDLALASRAKRPSLRGRLGFDRLELETLAGLAGLPRAEAQLALATRSLSWGGFTAEDATLAVSLKEGALAVAIQKAGMGLGVATGEITVEARGQARKLAAKLDLKGADAGKSLGWLFGTARVQGRVNLSLAAQAQGKTAEEMLAGLTGSGTLELADASLLDLDIPGLVNAASEKVVTGWAPVSGARTGVERLSASFTLADGVASSKDFTLDGTRLKVSGTAQVDFLRRAMLLRVDPELEAAGSEAARPLPVALMVDGPWAQPRFYPDMPGILTDPARAYAALKAMKGSE